MKRATIQTQPGEDPGPVASIDEIVTALLEEEAANGSLADSEIQRRFPDRWESVTVALRDARAISAAAQRARQLRDDPTLSRKKKSSEEDFSLLQQAMPEFEILQWVGSGGQGAVYRAIQKSTHRTVALKILLGSRLSSSNHTHRFSREVEIASQLQHANIVRVYDSDIVLGRPYFVMEFVEGMSIDDYVLAHRPTVKDRIRLFIKVCDAVSHAHQRGVIHRDLKSANVLVDLDGQPHVLDFGLAKCFDDTLGVQEELNVSLPGQVVGTLPYLSPEQAQGRPDDVDTRSDVYSLGIILYQILTGAMPYSLDGTPDTLRKRIAQDDPMSFHQAIARAELPPYDSEVFLPDDLEQIVRQALAKDKDRRYQSVDALAEDLGRFLEGQAVLAKADSAMYVLRKTVRRYRVQFAVAGAFVLTLIVAATGMFFLWQRAERLARMYVSGLEAGSYLQFASVSRDEGRIDDAIAMFSKAIEVSEMIASPDNKVLQLSFEAHHRLGEALFLSKDADAAKYHAQRAMELAMKGVEANSKDLEWQRSLAFAHKLFGQMEQEAGNYQIAIQHFHESREIRESLVRAVPQNINLRVELSAINRSLGECYRKSKNLVESKKHFQASFDIAKQLYDEDGGSLARSLDLGNAEVALATWYMVQPKYSGDEKARTLLEGLLSRLTKFENNQSGAPRARDIYMALTTARANLKKINNRSRPREIRKAASAPAN